MRTSIAFALAACTLAFGCEREDVSPTPDPAPKPATSVATCARRTNPVGAPFPASGSSGAVALFDRNGTTIAYVADKDHRSIHVVDVDMSNELSTTPLDGAPSGVALLSDGRVVVPLADRGEVAVFEDVELGKPLERRCDAKVAAEPTSVGLTGDGATLLVASRWGHALTAFATSDLTRRFSVDLARDPGAVVASSDGRKAFVAHVVGSRMSVVDLEGDHAVRSIDLHDRRSRQVAYLDMGSVERVFNELGKPKLEVRDQRADQGYALVRAGARILAPEAMVDSGDAAQSRLYGEAVSAFGDVAAIDEETAARVERPSFDGTLDDCLLPRAAAMGDGKLLVACVGLDQVVAYDATIASPHRKELRRYDVPGGPEGIATDDRHRAVVWSRFARRLSIIDLMRGKGEAVKSVALSGSSHLTGEEARGRLLFHETESRGRISFDGRACASCHPDGRDDALTWSTPEGRRQTPMLVGRLDDAAPYGWSGASKTLHDHLKHTFDRLAGRGLDAKEEDAIFAYVATLTTPSMSARAPREGDVPAAFATARSNEPIDPKVVRGDALFHASEVGCASCHVDDAGTDHAKHDVKSRALGDTTAAFDTPSLRFVGRSAPYFHDGRFATLADLLRATDGTMGHTKQLSTEDRDALAAYLETL